MWTGLDSAAWSSQYATDVKGAANYARFDVQGWPLSWFQAHVAAGLKMVVQFAGPYQPLLSDLGNVNTWAANQLNWYTANTNPTDSPYIEILNEPYGPWFWTSITNPVQTSEKDYFRSLVQATYNAFHNYYGSSAPKVIAPVDNVRGWSGWWQAGSSAYVDCAVVHPYGGTSDRTLSAQGNRQLISDAHTLTGKPVVVTEVGWPTGSSSTGDSFNWTESEQATNVTNFFTWARAQGYIEGVVLYNWRDATDPQSYGVVRSDQSHKPSYNALHNQALLDSGGGTTVPGSPTSVQGTAGNALVNLTWVAPSSNGGAAITSYRITPYIGSTAQTPINTGTTSTSYQVSGLTNGTTYTFKVAATNSVGTGSDSVASASLTPSAGGGGGSGGPPVFRAGSVGTWGAGTTTRTTSTPAGTTVGDLLLLNVEVDTNVTINTPSGWSIVISPYYFSTDGFTAAVFKRIADGTANDTPTITWGGATLSSQYGMMAYSGVSGTTPLNTASSVWKVNTPASLNCPVDALTTNIDNCLAVSLVINDMGQNITPAGGWTEDYDTPDSGQWCHKTALISPAGSTGSVTHTITGATNSNSLTAMFALQPPTGTSQSRTLGIATEIDSAGSLSSSNTVQPKTNVLDPFNRADNTDLGGNWTLLTEADGNSLAIQSNKLYAPTTKGSNVWSTQFTADQEAFVTISTIGTDINDYYGLWFRVNNPTSTNLTGYKVSIDSVSGTKVVRFYRFDGEHTFTQLGADINASTWGPGDKLWVTAIGTTFTAYRLPALTSTWQLLGSRTDATYNTTSYIGIEHGSTTWRSDDFGGGSLVSGSYYSIGFATTTSTALQLTYTKSGNKVLNISPAFETDTAQQVSAAAGPTPVPAPTVYLPLPDIDDWKWMLHDSITNQAIYNLPATSRQVEIVHNRGGSSRFTVPLDHESAYLINPHTTYIKVIKNGSTIWSGPVMTVSEDLASNHMQVGAIGWPEILNHRIIRKVNTGIDQTRTWLATAANTIIYDLLSLANTQRDGVLGTTGTVRPTSITQGVAQLTNVAGGFTSWPTFDYKVERGQNIWGAMQVLLDVENGVDMYINPDTRAMNLYYPQLGTDRPDLILGFNWGPHNLINVSRTIDGTRTMNRMTAYGKFGAGFAEDVDSQNSLGVLFEEEAQLNDISDSNVLLAYAGAEIIIRSTPLITHQLTLFPASDFAPSYNVDFVVGDRIRFSAVQGRVNIVDQAVRIFSVTLDIDDNGNEKISQVNISPVS